jgi:DNA processing protein
LAWLVIGLNKIYPSDHAGLAKDMIKNGGGILSEFFSGTKPDKHNFLYETVLLPALVMLLF